MTTVSSLPCFPVAQWFHKASNVRHFESRGYLESLSLDICKRFCGAEVDVSLTPSGIQIYLKGLTIPNLDFAKELKPYINFNKSSSDIFIIPYAYAPVFLPQFLPSDTPVNFYIEHIVYQAAAQYPDQVMDEDQIGKPTPVLNIMPDLFKGYQKVSEEKLQHFLKNFDDKNVGFLAWYIHNGLITEEDIIEFGNADAIGYLIPNKELGCDHPSQEVIWDWIETYRPEMVKAVLELVTRNDKPEIFCQQGITQFGKFFIVRPLYKIFSFGQVDYTKASHGGIFVEQALEGFFSRGFEEDIEVNMTSEGLVIQCSEGLSIYLSAQFAHAGILDQPSANTIVIPINHVATFLKLSSIEHDDYDLPYELVANARRLNDEQKKQVLLEMGYKKEPDLAVNVLHASLQPNLAYQKSLEQALAEQFKNSVAIRLVPQGFILEINEDVRVAVISKLRERGFECTVFYQKGQSFFTTRTPLLLPIDQAKQLFQKENKQEIFIKYVLAELFHRDSPLKTAQSFLLNKCGCHSFDGQFWLMQ